MAKNLKKICIIPARGGSKRIKRKNIKNFHGKPIIAYSIEAAIKSKCFDNIIVSTEDKEVAKIAKKYSAEVPFLRPKELSRDDTATIPVINHAIKEMTKIDRRPDLVCYLTATAPLIDYKNIKKALNILIKNNKKFVFTATSFPHPVQRAFTLDKDKNIQKMISGNRNTRTQDLKETYHDAGQIYWGKTEFFLKKLNGFSKITKPLILNRFDVIDLDTIEDWEQAKILFQIKNFKNKKKIYKK